MADDMARASLRRYTQPTLDPIRLVRMVKKVDRLTRTAY